LQEKLSVQHFRKITAFKIIMENNNENESGKNLQGNNNLSFICGFDFIPVQLFYSFDLQLGHCITS